MPVFRWIPALAFPSSIRVAGLCLSLLYLGNAASPAMAAEPAFPAVIRIGVPASSTPDGKQREGSTLGKVLTDAIDNEFAGTGTKVVWTYFVNAGPGINEAFAANQIDFALYGDFPAVIARSGGVPIKLVVPTTRGSSESYLVVPPNSPATSIEDLKGKKVAVNFGRPWMIAMERLLASKGLKKTDFQIYNLVMPDGDAAVAAGTIDGEFTLDGLQLQSRGLAKIIWSTKDAPLDWKFVADMFGREAFIQQYPEATRRLVRAEIRTAFFYSHHLDDYLQHLSTYQNIPLDLLKDEWQAKNVSDVMSPLFDNYVSAHYQQVIDYAFENKLIRRKFTASELLEPAFAQSVLTELGLSEAWKPVAEATVISADPTANPRKAPL